MTGRFAKEPVSTKDPHGQEGMLAVHLHLEIEHDEDVPFPLVQVGLAEMTDTSAFLRVVATNFTEDDTGARAVASLLRQTAKAIDAELDRTAPKVEEPPKRRGFNPRPAGPQMGGK